MHETEADRVQPLPFQTKLGCKNWVGPIHRIADARMPNRCHVDADLMGSAGFNLISSKVAATKASRVE